MEIGNEKARLMPLIMGPLFGGEKRPKMVYARVQSLILQYKTSQAAARALVPECFDLDVEPLVTITFGDFDGVDFMAGGGYRTATFGVGAEYQGERDHEVGQHILVMCEDRTVPILYGREYLGVPKIFADISAHRDQPEQCYRTTASLWGHLLFGIQTTSLKKQNPVVRAAADRDFNKYPWLCYKYIPSFDGPADASYPTVIWNSVKVDELWLGEGGTVFFGDSAEDDIGYLHPLVKALQGMPVIETVRSVRMQGSAVLRVDKSHRLH